MQELPGSTSGVALPAESTFFEMLLLPLTITVASGVALGLFIFALYALGEKRAGGRVKPKHVLRSLAVGALMGLGAGITSSFILNASAQEEAREALCGRLESTYAVELQDCTALAIPLMAGVEGETYGTTLGVVEQEEGTRRDEVTLYWHDGGLHLRADSTGELLRGTGSAD